MKKEEPKFLKIMKITLFLLFTCAFSVFAAPASPQNARVNINNGKGMTIGKFIDQVEKQTDYLFVYSKNEVNPEEKIDLKSGKRSVAQCLDEAFNGTKVKYAFENDYIVLTKKSA